jgi:hypothetical protein
VPRWSLFLKQSAKSKVDATHYACKQVLQIRLDKMACFHRNLKESIWSYINTN